MQNKAKMTPVHCVSVGSSTWPGIVTIRNYKTDCIHLFIFFTEDTKMFLGI